MFLETRFFIVAEGINGNEKEPHSVGFETEET